MHCFYLDGGHAESGFYSLAELLRFGGFFAVIVAVSSVISLATFALAFAFGWWRDFIVAFIVAVLVLDLLLGFGYI